jgi:tetratricopeptide (TPR) repeat protein
VNDKIAQLQSAVRLLQSGRPDEAVTALGRLLAIDENDAETLALLGLAHAHLGDNEAAAQTMARAIALNPHHPATLFNYGNVLRKLDRQDEAIDAYTRVLTLKPDHAEARRARGIALANAGRAQDALADLDRIATDSADTLTLRARLRMETGRTSDALADYDRLVALDPNDFAAWNNRGIALDRLERYADALQSYERALALRPNHHDALHNRGAALICLQRYDEALPLFERLIAGDPGRADNWSCHGAILANLLRIDEARASFEKGLALDPASLRALNGLGMAHVAQGRLDQGIAAYRNALDVHPGDAMTNGNLAFAQLVAGNLTEGFANYEWRRKDGPIGKAQRTYAQAEWQGEDLAGKTLLLHPEQGLGDVVQFARYVPELAKRGVRVVLEVPAPLERLMRSIDGAAVVVRSGTAPPPFDAHAPLMSLAHKLDTTLATIPARVPYLRAPEPERTKWRTRLASLGTVSRVGLCWAGHRIHRNDHARSIPLPLFAGVADVPGAAFVSLQREKREADAAHLGKRSNIVDWMDEVADFADTAALIAELDLVVTVDTSIAHVAGALGKPVWILIAAAPDWRWLLERADSPWYPTARLFRQQRLGDWASVVTAVKEALAKEIAA